MTQPSDDEVLDAIAEGVAADTAAERQAAGKALDALERDQ